MTTSPSSDDLAARDAELARIREERREQPSSFSLADMLSPERLAMLVGNRPGSSTIAQAASTSSPEAWASERFQRRLGRLQRAGVRLEDDELAAVACLLQEPVSEKPVDEVHGARVEAMRAIWRARAPRIPVFDDGPSLDASRRALASRRASALEHPFVMLCGSIGGGKTSAMGHAIASVSDSAYIDARALCDAWGSFDREERARVARLQAAPVLGVDEVKPELIAERKLGSVLSELIDARRGGGRITMMSTNMSMRDFGKCFTPQAVSRLRGRIEWVKVASEDLRGRRGGG